VSLQRNQSQNMQLSSFRNSGDEMPHSNSFGVATFGSKNSEQTAGGMSANLHTVFQHEFEYQ
jgi:hypothetical protein